MTGTGTQELAAAVRAEITDDIVPFWLTHAIRDGRLVGRVGEDLVPDLDAPLGLVLVTRLLWTFSAVARRLSGTPCLDAAGLAYQVLQERFRDQVHGGAFWAVPAGGDGPTLSRKQTYGQAFLIYGLAEYHAATGSGPALAWAREVYELLEDRARCTEHDGYLECFNRDWQVADELRLSEEDLAAPKSMNSHLHLMEAYTALHRVWPDPALRGRIAALVQIFLDHVIDPGSGHLHLYFDRDWTPIGEIVSPGHDIECSWLLCEAAEQVGDPSLSARVRAGALAMAEVTLRDAQAPDGGLPYELATHGPGDPDRHWWVQAEAVVGFLNAHQLSGRPQHLDAAVRAWGYTERHLLDPVHGEWFARVSPDGVPYRGEAKISEWKCPYHNGRMCLEVLERLGQASATTAPAQASPVTPSADATPTSAGR